MMELADVTDSKSVVGNNVWVRVPLPAPNKDPPSYAGGIFIIFAQLRPYNIGKINIRIYQNGGNIIKIGIANNK